VEVYNLFGDDLEEWSSRAGYERRGKQIGPVLGASLLGASLYELPPGEKTWPYHYEYGCEEWLLVVAGAPTLRTPEGERVLAPGDVVAFPEGPAGAHQVSNRSDAPVRVLILSTKGKPAVAVYPDSGKIGVWTGNDDDDALFRAGDAVDYWEGEA